MIQISPQEKIWIKIRMLCEELGKVLGFEVYDYLPGPSVKYPFVFIGEQFKQDERIQKDYLNGNTQVTVHVWHNDYKKRGTLTRMMRSIENAIWLEYSSDVQGVNTEVLVDNSTGSDLLHGILEIDIKF